MKTQILQLQPHDDIISTRDKLGWGQTGRVLLAWPRRLHGADPPRVLTRRLDLVLLQRHCARLGLQIALATQDPEVRAHARELKIPVFKTVRQAQSAHWRTRRRQEDAHELGEKFLGEGWEGKHADLLAPRLNTPRVLPGTARTLHPLLRWGLFTLAVLSLLALGGAVIPGAQITLQPKTRSQNVRFTLLASPDHSTVTLSGEAPARVYSMIVEGREARPVSGKTLAPEKAASARVRFTNLISDTVSIPAGLVISTLPKAGRTTGRGQSAVRFVTIEAGKIPGGVGKFSSLLVRAEKPGSSGNLPANSIVAIEGPLGLKLSVNNLMPTRGGSDLPAPAPNSADYEKLSAELVDTLRASALSDLQESLAPGDLVVTPTLHLAETLMEEFTPPRPEDDTNSPARPAPELRLSLRLKFEVLVISGEDVRSLSTRILDAGIPEGYTPLSGSLNIKPAAIPQVEEGVEGSAANVRWLVRATRRLQAQIDPDQVAALTRGQISRQAEGLLQDRMPLAAQAHIAITPTWWPRLPLLFTKISVKILEGGGE